MYARQFWRMLSEENFLDQELSVRIHRASRNRIIFFHIMMVMTSGSSLGIWSSFSPPFEDVHPGKNTTFLRLAIVEDFE